MKPIIQDHLTWLANQVAESYLHSKNPEHTHKDIQEACKKFYDSLRKTTKIDWENMDLQTAKELRFARWDEDSDLSLIPIWLYPMIPNDLELTSIGGRKAFVKDIDTDIRYGVLAWGIYIHPKKGGTTV